MDHRSPPVSPLSQATRENITRDHLNEEFSILDLTTYYYKNMKHKIRKWTRSYHENDGMCRYGGRDVMGNPARAIVGTNLAPKWPYKAKVAINFCIHLEEGGEQCLLHGDSCCESCAESDDVTGPQKARENKRNLNLESLYDYGPRVGFWRLYRIFTQRKLPCTFFAVGMALERNPVILKTLKVTKEWEIASQGYRCMDYHNVDEVVQREHIDRSVEIQDRILEKRPVGYLQGKPNLNTRRILVEEGGFQYDSDSYAEDLPYWCTEYSDRPHLIIPFTKTETDLGFVTPNGFATGSQFADHLIATLDQLIEEANDGTPKMMTISLHCRLARPGRVSGLVEFLEYCQFKSEVWIATREEIANFWNENHFPLGAGEPLKPWYDSVHIQKGLSTLSALRASLPSIPKFTSIRPPEQELGESDVI